MNSSLQNANLTAEDLTASLLADHAEEHAEGEESHIHLPNPSLWPLILSAAIALCVGGLISWTNGNVPWVAILALPFVLMGMMGWALENPMAPTTASRPVQVVVGAALILTILGLLFWNLYTGSVATLVSFAVVVVATIALVSMIWWAMSHKKQTIELISYAESMETGQPTVLAEALLQQAQDVADRIVTIGSTAWSAHPVQVEIEREGVVLALYGKVELEAQRQELADALLNLPGVIDVRNFLVAEDALLNAVNARINSLKEAGKLEGANDLSVLVENYIVSLYGHTPTSAMKQTLEKEIVAIPGVRVVINHIGLDEAVPGNLGRTNNKVGK